FLLPDHPDTHLGRSRSIRFGTPEQEFQVLGMKRSNRHCAVVAEPRALAQRQCFSLLTTVFFALVFALPLSGCGPAGRRAPERKGEAGGLARSQTYVFRDRAAEAGLTFRWGHGGRSPLNIKETAGGGCAFLDYDGDGKLDILLVGSTLVLYHNEGGGRFRDVS